MEGRWMGDGMDGIGGGREKKKKKMAKWNNNPPPPRVFAVQICM